MFLPTLWPWVYCVTSRAYCIFYVNSSERWRGHYSLCLEVQDHLLMSSNTFHQSMATATQGAADFTPVVSKALVHIISCLGTELWSLSSINNKEWSQKWWGIGRKSSWVWSQPDLQTNFQDNQVFRETTWPRNLMADGSHSLWIMVTLVPPASPSLPKGS